jgi:hypothetical protein
VPDDARIVDQRDDTHRPLALRALQRIGLVHLADEPAQAALARWANSLTGSTGPASVVGVS